MTDLEIRRLIWTCFWMASGRAPNAADDQYWRVQKWQEMVDRGRELHFPEPPALNSYPALRLLGWQATGADAPPYGPYADPSTPQFKSRDYFGPVPPFPGEEPPPGPPPNPPPDPADLSLILTRLDRLTDAVEALITRPAPNYVGETTAGWPIGHVKVVLKPEQP